MNENSNPWRYSAEEEYSKDDQLNRGEVQDVIDWMKTQPYLPTDVSEETVLHVYFSCFYDVEKTKETVERLFTYRATMPEIFDGWDPCASHIQQVYSQVLYTAVLPELDKDGNRVAMIKFREKSSEFFIQADLCKWMIMGAFLNLWMEGTGKGYLFIMDASQFGLRHLMKCSMKTTKNFIDVGTRSMPLRLTKVVIVNSNVIIKKMYNMFKPFLPTEIIALMHFYSDPNEYFQDFPPHQVPSDYGGSAPSIQEMQETLVNDMIQYRTHLMDQEKLKAVLLHRIKS